MPPTRVRVGVLGLTHDHVWSNLDHLAKLDNAELVGAAEPDPALREKFTSRFGGRLVFDDYDGLLEGQHDLQAVFCFASNRQSAELGARAASRGLHVLMEKPMASNLRLAEKLVTTARRHNVLVHVNFPINWNAKLREAHRLALAGEVGDVFKVRYAGGHGGPREIGCSEIFCNWLYDAEENGVGALFDQGCYAALVVRWFLGRPHRVIASGGRLTKTDITDLDNAVILARYHNAIGVAETSWSWVGGLPVAGPIVYGTEGTLWAHAAREPGGVSVIKRGQREPTVYDAPSLPDDQQNAPQHFVSCIINERPLAALAATDVTYGAQEILEAAAISIQTGGEVTLPLDGMLPGLGG